MFGTLVKTNFGYQSIENLQIGDTICGPNGLQKILYSSKLEHDSYLIIKLGQNYIKTFPDQLFYLLDGTLKKAIDLRVIDQLENGKYIDEIFQIQEPCISYFFSTTDQSFYVYPDICVHNFDPITLGSTSFSLGIIEFIHPVLLLAGGIYLLHSYAMNYFKTKIAYEFEFDNEDPDLTAENLSLSNADTVKETRSYYVVKRQELFDMYQQLIQFKNNLVGIVKPNFINSISFAHNFLSIAPIMQYQQLRLPSIDYEYKLSAAQKIQLLKVRDEELEKLQKDIFELHLYVAFYINEIVEHRDIAHKAYQQFGDQFSQFAEQWNINTSNMPYNIAVDTYSLHFVWQDTLNNLEIKTQEVECFLKYYKSLENSILISKTTNFSNIFNPQLCINKDIFTSIKDSRCNWQFNMMTIEDYLRRNNWLSQELINNLKNQIQQRRVAYEKDEKDLIACAKKKKNAVDNVIQNNRKKQPIQQTPNFKGPDKDPEDDFFEKLKKNYAKKGRTRRFGNIYKDKQTGLWWSKSNVNHADPHYKVFREAATGLEWIKDVDLRLNTMTKHKGPIGRFIPYKDIIFLP
ncbi:MAG: hypothetical protein HYU67_13835 [Flavobacteriia bacterium]|nr:hypothetical protein [Flavobacteriia bacterium]